MTAFRLQTFTHQCVSYRSETVSGHPAEYLPAFGSQPVLNSDPVRCICGNIQIFKAQSLAFMNHAPWMKINSTLDIFRNPALFVFAVRADGNVSISMLQSGVRLHEQPWSAACRHSHMYTHQILVQTGLFFFFFPLVVACDSHRSCGSVGCFKRHSRGGSSPIR